MKASKRFITVFGILFLLTLCGVLPVRQGEAAEPDLENTRFDYRPGKTNPVANPARWCLMAKDMLGDATHNTSTTMMQYWNEPKDDSLGDWKMVSGGHTYSVPACNIDSGPVALTKGRILTVLKDTAALAFIPTTMVPSNRLWASHLASMTPNRVSIHPRNLLR